MLTARYVMQPRQGVNYLELFKIALGSADFTRLDAAVAYATTRGVAAIQGPFDDARARLFEHLRKRWLVGIDWCRSEPLALERLADLPRSSVRVPSGLQTVGRRGCTPLVPFHPKAFLLRGPGAVAVISGSGNLSRNGLTRGHELGSVLVFRDPLSEREKAVYRVVSHIVAWFGSLWNEAAPLSRVAPRYAALYEHASNMRLPVPTDDDAAITGALVLAGPRRRAIPPERLRQLRAARNLWIEADGVTKNRGPGQPGNQLMLSPMTRVFFGFPAVDVDPNTSIGHVAVRYGDHTRPDCSLRFSDNSMDVLTLPVPGSGGPAAYDRRVLLFTKSSAGVFDMQLATGSDASKWRRRSNAIDGGFRMTSGRAWGVF